LHNGQLAERSQLRGDIHIYSFFESKIYLFMFY
jgi:hypothetical protein